MILNKSQMKKFKKDKQKRILKLQLELRKTKMNQMISK